MDPTPGSTRRAPPNPIQAHKGLARAGKCRADPGGHVTQNIDGLHQKGRFVGKWLNCTAAPKAVTVCKCAKLYGEDWLTDESLVQDSYPRCTVCGGVIKPDVVLFEEMLPAQAWNEAQERCVKNADVIFVIGSSLSVAPANYLPESGLRRGASLIINTQSDTHLDRYADVVIQEDLERSGPGHLPFGISRIMLSARRAAQIGAPAYPPINGSWSGVRAGRCAAIRTAPARGSVVPVPPKKAPARP